ncbi:armadillo-type protein [Halteromyces radiatus]|uniref:armadillo-type protein n=1 Tax=Halteromyces radiatus TaxID=101107 RepID=UPI00222016A5|nr:armadillo-type protein [Halteromyces radiatus]KAI8099122.1 armadillo-type protein [Halteromyces radiatus]
METAQEDFQSLPITERLQHKVWKARQSAYTELYDLFRKTVEDADFYQYEEYLKNIATDANAVAQETGLNAIYEYVNNAPNASNTRESVVPALVQKCLGAPKAGTKQKATSIILLYAEIDVADPVVELVLPGLQAKQPKLVTQTVVVLRELVRQFGTKTVSPKPLIKTLPKLFGHTDRNVRAETFTLTTEIYRWIGAALTPSLSDLKPVQIKELEEAFAKLPSEKPTPERLLRSEQQKLAETEAMDVETGDTNQDEDEAEPMDEEPMDPFDLADPIDITSKLPGNFYELLASKKWQERREALDALLESTKTPKIMDKDYSELVGALTKRIGDSNILLVGTAANCIESIAKGLRTEFGKYKGMVVPPMIEKLKERKPAILEQLVNSLHAVFSSVPILEITEDLSIAVKHKNPQIRAQSVKLLTRQLQTIRQVPSKSETKIFAEMMLKTLDDADASAREASAEGLGTLMKVVAFDKAEVKAKPVVAKKPQPPPAKKPVPAPPKKVKPSKPVESEPEPMAVDSEPMMAATEMTPPKRKPPARLLGGNTKKPTLSSSKPKPATTSATSGTPKKAAKLPPSSGPEEVKYRYSPEDAEARVSDYIPEQIWDEIGQSQWKVRLAAMESLYTHLESSLEPSDIEAEIVIRCLSKKPGWKEMNFQVMTKLYGVMQLLATVCPSFSRACAAIGIPGMVEKLGDIKLKKPAGECLVTFAEKTSLQFVLSQSYPIWKKAKSPKVLADSLIWIHQALSDFGIAGLQVRDLIDFVKTALSNTNASVRTSAVTVLGILRMYIGPEIITFVQDVSPALMATIESEFEKVSKLDPPQPTKFSASVADGGSGKVGNSGGGGAAEVDALDSLIPRADISNQLGKVAADCNDANWKKRKEGLDKVLAIIDGANKRIKPNLGEFPSVLKQRLNDSNKLLQIQAVEITGLLVVSMGKPFEKYVKALAGSVTSVLSDNKANVRSAGIATLEIIRQTCGFEGLIGAFGTSLAADSPALRKELLTWLSTSLNEEDPSGTIVDYSPLISPLLSCLQDRNADVRKAAQNVLPMVVANTGFDNVMNKVSELKGAQRQTVMPFVEAARGSASGLPSTATATASSTAPVKSKRPTSSTTETRRPDSAASSGSEDKPTRLKSTLGRKKLLAPRSSAAAAAAATTSSTTATNSTEQSQPPLLSSDPRAKQVRAKKEIRWQFDNPRSDVVDTLRSSCESHIQSDILGLMFSTSQYAERDRLNALNQLDECIANPDIAMDKYGLSFDDMKKRYLANADLLFKYLTIRFFDTNTSMLIKCLDLTEHLVAVFDVEGAPLSEYEAVSFLPFLINKVGDPKETIRGRIRTILKAICIIYPASKLLNFLLDTAANSKNAKARAECLDEVGALIQRNGTSVMLPNKALPLIATHIGDRDAGVRNAALNAIAQAYILIGDPVFKYVNRLGEKEKGMLEERLKRTKPSASVLAEKERIQQQQQQQQESDEMDVDDLPPITSLPRTPRSRIGKPRSLPQPVHHSNINSRPTSMHQESEPMEGVMDEYGNQYLQDRGSEPRTLPGPSSMRQPRSATQQQMHHGFHSPPPPPALQQYQQQQQQQQQQHMASPYYATSHQHQDQREYIVDYIISQITSGDPQPSIEALKQLDKHLNTRPEVILPDIEPLINAITLQVRLAYSTVDPRSPVTTRLCKHLVNALVLLFTNRDLAGAVSQDALHHLLQELAHRLLDQKMLSLESGPQLSKALNVAMVKVLENSQRNATFSALLSILGTCSAGLRPGDLPSSKETKYTELIMKCLWKLAKTIQENLRSGSLQPDQLLFEINKFFLVTPPNEWKRRTQDNVPLGELPLRTVKTLLLEMVNGLGEGVFQHLVLIDDPQNSSVYPYLHHMLEACKKKEMFQQQQQQQHLEEQQQMHQQQHLPVDHTNTMVSMDHSTQLPSSSSPQIMNQQQHQYEPPARTIASPASAATSSHEESPYQLAQQSPSFSRPSSISSIRSGNLFRSTSIGSFPSSDGQMHDATMYGNVISPHQQQPPPITMSVAGMTTYQSSLPSPMAESHYQQSLSSNHQDDQAQPMQIDGQGAAMNKESLSDYEMNNVLKVIFEKIGTREQTKQGIVELYEFQKRYPLAENKVNTYLSQTGTYFQRYIQRGLHNLAAEDHGI